MSEYMQCLSLLSPSNPLGDLQRISWLLLSERVNKLNDKILSVPLIYIQDRYQFLYGRNREFDGNS